jgi:hypothetical protein
MFKRKPKIISIAVGISGDLIFTIGLGRDGNAYSWDSVNLKWVLHQSVKQKEQK